MPVIIHLDDTPLATLMDKIEDVTGDFRDGLELAGNEATNIVAEKFRLQGPGWTPLAERTKLRRRNKDKGSIQILQDEGKLRASITAPESDPQGIYQLTQRSLIIGSNLISANTHQYGNPDGFKRGINIPARPYLPTDEELVPRVERKLTRYLEEWLT